jgi:3D (Asp-Asp-Asp) domain-containing protein
MLSVFRANCFLLLALLAVPAHGAEITRIYTVTAYCPCAKCCGRAGMPTANGQMPAVGVTVAAPRSLPFGTRLRIEGLGERIVQDRQSKRFDDRIDVFVSDRESAIKFGVRKLEVTVIR